MFRLFLVGVIAVYVAWGSIVADRLLQVFKKGGPDAASALGKLAKLFLLNGLVAMILSLFAQRLRIEFLMTAGVVWLFAGYFLSGIQES